MQAAWTPESLYLQEMQQWQRPEHRQAADLTALKLEVSRSDACSQRAPPQAHWLPELLAVHGPLHLQAGITLFVQE